MAHQILTDVIEYLTEKILFEKENRLENYKTLEYFWNLLEQKDNDNHLLLFVRYKLAKIVTAVCHTDAYDTLEDSDESLLPVVVKKQKSILSPALPLVRWTHHHWTDLENLLLAARDNLIHLHNSNASTDQQQDAHFYNVDSLVRYIRVNRALSDIRWDLQEQLMKNNNDMSSNITMDPAVLATFGETVEKDFSHDNQARMALENLLVRRSDGTVVSFVNQQKLHSLLHKKPFDLTNISNKLELLLQKWARRHVSTRAPPTLIRLDYNPVSNEGEELQPSSGDQESENENDILPLRLEPQPLTRQLGDNDDDDDDDDNNENESPHFVRRPKRKKEEQHEQHVAKLISARRNLHKDGGKDPMQEILANAAKAAAAMREPATTMYDKKPSAKQVQFDDSESEEEEGGVILSDLPTRARITSKQQESSLAKSSPRSNHGKRMRFTDDEKRAIREGVRMHGAGKWSQIKSEYAVILKNRTTINIKDCYRTMCKKDEV